MLRAPFPWFGGKSRAASLIWLRLGDVPNYVEPFAGSLAVLLARPHPARVETVNDKDAYLANFWRAIRAAPDEVAYHADWPVNEADLHARHLWLVTTGAERVEQITTDPTHYDARVAGWWVWGLSMWIGSGWCEQPNWKGRVNAGRAPRGVEAVARQVRDLASPGQGVHKKRPHLMTAGKGVPDGRLSRQLPHLGDAGCGVHRAPPKQLPHLNGNNGAAGSGIHASGFEARTGGLYAYFQELAARLRRVRVCCGDWTRVLGPSVTEKIGVTGILLDPPYADTAGRDPSIYREDDSQIAHRVREWAIANGDNPLLRIALCGYEGEHEMPDGWECVPWKANGGYSNSRRSGTNDNPHRERVYFSPHCLKPVEEAGRFPAINGTREGQLDDLPLFENTA